MTLPLPKCVVTFKYYTITQLNILSDNWCTWKSIWVVYGLWRDMQQNRYLQDCTHLEYDFFVYKADLCSHDMYLQDEKNLKEIGWVMSMLWEIPHFMTWACLWSNLRLFMHRYTCALDVKFLISQEPPNGIWVCFFYSKGMIAPTFQAFVHEFWVRSGYRMLKVQ